jgi:hypothetical protein
MTTYSSTSIIIQANNANFNTWVNEIYTGMVTQCGLPQLPAGMDSGQFAVPAAFAGVLATSTAAGYYMFAFNDTLSQGPLVTGTALSLGSTGASGSVVANAHIGTGYYASGGTITVTGVALSYAPSGGLGGTAGTGSGAIGTVVINTSGQVTSITPTTAGTGYLVGDTLTFTQAALAAGSASGGVIATGSGALCYVQLLTNAAAPIILKIEFGAGSGGATVPQMWHTMGTGWTISSSNGQVAAVSNGAVTTRVALMLGNTFVSSTVAYPSRFCYNASLGFLGAVFKIGNGTVNTNQAMGAIMVFRTSSNSGAATGNAACSITCGATASSPGVSATNGSMQCMSYTNNTVYPTLLAASSGNWIGFGTANGTWVFGLTTSLENGTVFITPAYTIDPGLRFSALIGLASVNDFPVGNTAACAIIGATPLTFLSVGQPWANNGWGGASFATNNPTLCMLWQ